MLLVLFVDPGALVSFNDKERCGVICALMSLNLRNMPGHLD